MVDTFSSDGNERIEVYYGQESAMNVLLQAMNNVKKEAAVVSDAHSPAFSMGVEPVKRRYQDFKKRGVKVRQIVEITKDNIEYCKEFMSYVELRHLDDIKGNIAVSETEYVATATLQGATPVTRTIYSNVNVFLEQQRYFFETLWNKAIPAEQKIRELETGLSQPETRIVNDAQEIGKEIEDGILTNTSWCICSGFGGLELGYKLCLPAFKKVLLEGRNTSSGISNDDTDTLKNNNKEEIDHNIGKNGEKAGEIKSSGNGRNNPRIRWITSFDKNGIGLVKFYLSLGIRIRHIREVPLMQFGVGDKKIIATVEEYEGGGIFQTALISNESNYIKHYNMLFEELWRSGIDAQERINEIEEGVEPEFLEVITDGEKAAEIFVNLAKSVTKEAQLILTHPHTMGRVAKLGIWDYLVIAANKGADIRVISPLTEANFKLADEIISKAPTIKIVAGQQVDAGLLVVDNRQYLRAEVKNAEAESTSAALGRMIYSNSKIGVNSFKSFFEILWQQIEMYEKLRAHDKMQTEFANIAAHELRTPIQPILGVIDMLKLKQSLRSGSLRIADDDDATDIVIADHSSDRSSADRDKPKAKVAPILEIGEVGITAYQLAILDRNARRLQRLSSEILDATRIEAGTLKLDKEMFDINKNVRAVVAEATSWIPADQKIEIKFKPAATATGDVMDQPIGISPFPLTPLLVMADKLRIFEVISNLISNAIKFSDASRGEIITISTEKKEHDNEVVVSVKDRGSGISAEMMPLLFTKFATEKDKGGIGLGLFIAKNIIEAHGGKIWGKNNPDGKGATFAFTLPLE